MVFSEPSEDVEVLGPDAGGALSFEAAEDVIAGQVVKLDGDFLVEPSDTDGEDVVGVATQTVAAGAQVQVAGPGTRVKFTAGTSGITDGDLLASHGATGEEGQVDTGDAADDRFIGKAFESSSAQGDLVEGIVTYGRMSDSA